MFAGTRRHFFHVYKSPKFRCSVHSASVFIASCRRARGLISVLTGALGFSTLFTGAQKLIVVCTGHRRFITVVTEVDEKLKRGKSHWLRRGIRMNKNRMAKIILNYSSNGRRRLGRPLKRLLDEAVTGLSRYNSWRMKMMMTTTTMTIWWYWSPPLDRIQWNLSPVFVPARSRPPHLYSRSIPKCPFCGPFHQIVQPEFCKHHSSSARSLHIPHISDGRFWSTC